MIDSNIKADSKGKDLSFAETHMRKTDLTMEGHVGSGGNSFLKGNQSEELLSAELDALDLSVIPQNTISGSVLRASILDESAQVDNPNNLKPLVLENSGIKTKGWCRSCVVVNGKCEGRCVVM